MKSVVDKRLPTIQFLAQKYIFYESKYIDEIFYVSLRVKFYYSFSLFLSFGKMR